LADGDLKEQSQFPGALTNVTCFYTKDYGNQAIGCLMKTNPIQRQSQTASTPKGVEWEKWLSGRNVAFLSRISEKGRCVGARAGLEGYLPGVKMPHRQGETAILEKNACSCKENTYTLGRSLREMRMMVHKLRT
jgi:hypothetical protein